MDMEPAESVDLADIEGKDSRIVPEEYETEGYPWLDYQDPIMDMAAEQEAAAAVEAAIQEQASKDLGQSLHGGAEDNQGMDQGGFDPGGGFVDQGGQGEFGGGPSGPSAPSGSTAAGGPTYGPHGGASYGPHGGGGGGGGGGGKIVCTMMNDSYGFGSFRNKIWLRQSKNLAPEYQIGYHKIFLQLVRLSKTIKLLKKTLEHIAVHITIDIRQEARGKVHLLGRVYRKVLEPICYWVGKHAKR